MTDRTALVARIKQHAHFTACADHAVRPFTSTDDLDPANVTDAAISALARFNEQPVEYMIELWSDSYYSTIESLTE